MKRSVAFNFLGVLLIFGMGLPPLNIKQTSVNAPIHASAEIVSAGAGVYDDVHSGWKYVGAWAARKKTGSYKNTVHLSKKIGASASFKYLGGGFVLYYMACPTCGKLNVFVDGQKVKTLNQYAAKTRWKKTWMTSLLYNGNHTAKFVHASGAMVSIDALQITQLQPPPNGPTIGGCPVYPFDNIWNVRVDSLPVHTRSTAWINSIGSASGFHMDFGSGKWEGGLIGIPYNIVSASQTTKYHVTFYYPDESDAGPYPIPANPKREFGSDHHILLVDTDQCNLYEIYDASYAGGKWSGGSGAIWDMQSNALRTDGWTSADAAGLPILPGLVRYEEVLAGEINHAIRFTASNTNSYTWPARHLTSGSPGVLTDTPPMGARFRLKAGFDISGYPAAMQVILKAMKTYGIMLADNGADWYVSGAPDARWNNDMLHLLDNITGNDFEAVDVSGLMVSPDSGATLTNYWSSSIGNTLQIQYDGALDTSKPVDIYNVDMFDTSAAEVAGLHTQGKKVMCYINAGSWEDWRPDASQFPLAVLGNDYDGWPGEKWLDIRRVDLLAPILRARLDLCKSKGFDGVDPDNVNGFENPTGFPLSAQDQINFNIWLANEAHTRGLSIGLKNDSGQIASLLPNFDWALTEDCFDQGWCADMSPFIQAGKPVFAVEYTDTGIDFNLFCTQAASLQFGGLQKHRALDAFLQSCP